MFLWNWILWINMSIGLFDFPSFTFSGLFLRNIYRVIMSLLPDTQNSWLCMRRDCRERFPRHRLQRKPLVNDPGMHHGTCVTHVPWCMSRSLTRCDGENVFGIPGAFTTLNFAYLVRGPWNAELIFWCWIWLLMPCLLAWSTISRHIISIDLFHNNFSPNGYQPEHRALAHEL